METWFSPDLGTLDPELGTCCETNKAHDTSHANSQSQFSNFTRVGVHLGQAVETNQWLQYPKWRCVLCLAAPEVLIVLATRWGLPKVSFESLSREIDTAEFRANG